MSKSVKVPHESGAGHDFSPKRLGEIYERMVNSTIGQFCCDDEVRPRQRLNKAVVQEYSELMKTSQDEFPAVHALDADGKIFLIDGYHRLEAARLAGREKIACFLHKGDRRHAILLSASANIRNGLSRTRADKRRAVTKLLSDAEWRQWSDRLIARYCGVTQPFVSGLRAKMANVTDNVITDSAINNDSVEEARGRRDTRKFITKQGEVAVMHLPKRRSAPVTACAEKDNGDDAATALPFERVPRDRAEFAEVIVHVERIVRTTPLSVLRLNPAADNALCEMLEALAQLLTAKAEMLARPS